MMIISKLDTLVRRQESLSGLSRDDIRKTQLYKLNALLRRLKASGRAFYADLPERLDSLDSLEELPFTTAEDIRRHGAELLLKPQSSISRIVSESTSGTAGDAKRVYYTDFDCDRTVEFFAAGLGELVRRGDSVLICMPFSGGRGLGGLISEALERLGAKPVRAGTGLSFGALNKLIMERRPRCFVGMPVPLLSQLRLYGRQTLETAVVSGDACPPSVSRRIEELLGSPLFPHYGLRETCMGGAVTCPAHDGMHLRENDIIAEIIDANGSRLPDGEPGELVLTTIGLEGMPLLRYKTGDIAKTLGGACPCGSELLRLKDISRAGNDIYRLDDRLFGLDYLIDYYPSGKCVTALTVGGKGYEGIKKAAPEIFSDAGYELVIRAAGPEDKPLFPGKRFREHQFQIS